MPNDQRQCVLVFDEMTIKSGLNYDKKHDCIEGIEGFAQFGRGRSLASHALVFMVRGLKSRWKQAFGYFVSSGNVTLDKLKLLAHESIDRLSRVCFNFNAICDQGTSNQKLFRDLGVTCDKPFITHEQKVYTGFGPLHLLTNVRNNVHKFDFKLNGKTISRQYIRAFYNFDSEQRIRFAPKLTSEHQFSRISKMIISLASQVFFPIQSLQVCQR